MTPIHGLTSGMELTASCSQEVPWASVGLLQWSLCILQLSVLEGWGSWDEVRLNLHFPVCGKIVEESNHPPDLGGGAFFSIIPLVSWLILPLEGEFYGICILGHTWAVLRVTPG